MGLGNASTAYTLVPSKLKNTIGVGAIEVANQYRQYDIAMNSMFKRHRDAMHIASCSTTTNCGGMAVHNALPTNLVSRQLYNVSDNILDYAGIDSTSRQDLNRLLVNQTKGVATGVVAGGVYHTRQTRKNLKNLIILTMKNTENQNIQSS